jgi:long-chain acyl-CoA synthetase
VTPPGEPTGLAALVRAAATRTPDAPAVVDGDTRVTWGGLDALVDRAAAGFAARGLSRGDRVAVQLPNGLPWLRAVLGALRAGLVVVPVNTASTAPEVEHVLADSGAALLVAATEREPVAGVPVVAGPPEDDGPPPADDDDPAALSFLAYTSGTTGRPRGAMLTAAALRANQRQCLAMDPPPVRADDRVLVVLPLFHVYGLNAGFGLVAATGACAVLLPAFDPRASLEVVEREGVTAVPGAPPVYQAWLAVADAADGDGGGDARLRRALSSVRVASSGAAPLPAATWRAMRDRAGVQVWEGYGLTEACPVVASTLATGRPKPACIGGPLPGVEVALREVGGDGPGADAGEGPGEIWVRGPNVFAGFWPDGADGPDDDGWLATGDLAHRDADGDLHLVDRRSDLVLVSGFNVYPAEVERVLDAHPAVAESAVIGVPDPRTGAAVVAVVVPAAGAEVDAAELRAHAAASLARYKVPTSVVVRPALPHSLTGKVSRARLRELGLDVEAVTGEGAA